MATVAMGKVCNRSERTTTARMTLTLNYTGKYEAII